MFQATSDRTNYQGRYVMRHPWTGDENCPEADRYREQLYERQKKEAQNLASLTGWSLNDIHQRMDLGSGPTGGSWWDRLWGE